MLSTTGIIISHTETVFAKSKEFYIDRGKSKQKTNDYKGAIEDFTKAIKFNPKDVAAFFLRGISKDKLGDKIGSCIDGKQALSLGLKGKEKEWVEENCS